MKRKIWKKILWWHVKLRKWYLHKTKHLTTRGLYVCYYIIDKYLLGKKPDDQNDDYEKPVTATLERMKLTHFFERIHVSENRTDAAFFTLGNFMLFATDEMRQQVYDYLGEWPYKARLEEYIKSGVIV